MNFTCDNCQRRYSISDDKVRGKTVKVRCKNCTHLITLQGPSEPDEEQTTMMPADQMERLRSEQGGLEPAAASAPVPAAAPSIAPASLPNRPEWFVMVRGKQTGPLDPRGLAELVRSGDLNLRSYVWRKGMGEWKRSGETPELSFLFTPSAPAPSFASATGSAAPKASRNGVSNGASKGATNGHAAHVSPLQTAAPVVEPQAAGTAGLPFEPDPADVVVHSGPRPQDEVRLGELFSDADADTGQQEALANGDATAKPQERAKSQSKGEVEDPFAALGELDPSQLPPPGEATAFFIAQAGVNKRNPPWKIAVSILAPVGVVAGLLFLLNSFNVVPLRVKTVDAEGKEVTQSVFSAEGVSSLGDLLMGNKNKNAADQRASDRKVGASGKTASTQSAPVPSGANMPKVESANARAVSKDEIAALYMEAGRTDKGPKLRKDARDEAKSVDSSTSGLSDEQVAKVVSENQSGFQSCIEQELRKNPSLRVPRFYIVAVVANSGVVKSASIDRKEIDGSSLGECLKVRTRRMVFSKFAGDEMQLEIPLIVGTTM